VLPDGTGGFNPQFFPTLGSRNGAVQQALQMLPLLHAVFSCCLRPAGFNSLNPIPASCHLSCSFSRDSSMHSAYYHLPTLQQASQ
jgi:hypothetical protein